MATFLGSANALLPETLGCRVASRGYRVVDDALVPVPGPVHIVQPLREPALVRILASIEDDAGIVAFASRYGELGIGRGLQALFRIPRSAKRARAREAMQGEPLGAWWYQIYAVRAALALIDAKLDQRRRWIRFEDGHAVLDLPVGGNARVHRDALDLEIEDARAFGLREGDTGRAALAFAARIINPIVASNTNTQVVLDPTTRGLALRLVPKNLLGMLAIQLVATAEGELVTRPCAAPGCRAWIDASPGSSRSDRRTCSDTCRKRLERKRARKSRRSA